LQAEQRRREHARRLAIVQTVDDIHRRFGLTGRRIAQAIGISQRTLRDWRRKLRLGRDGSVLRGRGRPTFVCDVETRNRVLRFLHHVTGPVVGLPALRALFPHVPRCVLANLLARYRRVWRRRYCPWGKRLVWHIPGSVWAIDFSKAPYPIDGVDWHIFAVRDLASRYQLAWRAVAGERAAEVIAILRSLFQAHGPPLVLKSDNGSAFIAEVMEEAMRAEQVIQLFSPVGRPSYNGGLERSNRVNKMYTAQHAISAGHEHQWLASDLEAARRIANQTTRPWGHEGPTPEQAWEGREPLSDEQRTELLRSLVEQREHSAEQLGIDLTRTLHHADRSRLDRHALLKVLTQLGYLTLRCGQRMTKKPKRVTPDDIARRISCLTTSPSRSPHATANQLPPLMNHRPCVDNARRGRDSQRVNREPTVPSSHAPPTRFAPPGGESSTSPASRRLLPPHADAHRDDTIVAHDSIDTINMLADPAQLFTMQADQSTATSTTDQTFNGMATHCERTVTSWWRRLITPLVSPPKAAINTG
jgi:hypothetical protein